MTVNTSVVQSQYEFIGHDRNVICENDKLHVEIVTHIMKFLTYSDRKSAGLVNYSWYCASLDPFFLDKDTVVFDHVTLQDDKPPLSIIRNSSRPFYHFIFSDLEMGTKVMEKFWADVGSQVRSIVIDRCDICERHFTSMLMACPNLESLRIECCSELLMSGTLFENFSIIDSLSRSLTKMKSLKFVSNRYLSDALFNRFVSIAPNIEVLSLSFCPVACHPALYKKFYPSDNTPSKNVLTFLNVLKFLSEKATSIKCLDFNGLLIDSITLTKIATLETNLESIFLVNCDQLSNAGVLALTQNQKNLKVLDLSSCSRITDQALISICDSLKNLTELSVRNCRAITDLGVSNLAKLTALKELDFSQCESITSNGIISGLCQRKNMTLRVLKLAALRNINDDTLVKLAECLPNLIYFDLSHCFNAVTDRSVQAIFQHQVWLRVLKLVECNEVSDAGFTGMSLKASSKFSSFDDLNKISPLRIFLGSKAEDKIIKDAVQKKAVKKLCELQNYEESDKETYSIARLQGLRELNLSGCNRITDVSLKYAFRFPELRVLDMSKCQQVTGYGLKFLCENNASLEIVSLGECFNLDDDGVNLITFHLKRLKFLDLKGCELLSDRTIDSIIENCKKLQYLNIRNCERMTVEKMDRLSSSVQSLQVLFVSSPTNRATMFKDPPPPPDLPTGRL